MRLAYKFSVNEADVILQSVLILELFTTVGTLLSFYRHVHTLNMLLEITL